MKLSQDLSATAPRIRSYEPGRITINDETYHTSVIVTPERVLTDWPPADLTELDSEHLQALLELEPELVLLGTGPEQRFPSQQLLREVIRQGIGVEVMNTGAACRTYGILVAEERRVVAALLLR